MAHQPLDTMSNMTEINDCLDYKTFCGFKYHKKFPDEWILNEKPNTGRECWNCVGNRDNKGFAMWRGVIIGYCQNCATDYDMTRGRGFIRYGVENDCSGPTAFDLYLGEIDWDNYGDLEANPEDTLENRRVFLEEEYEEESEEYLDNEDDFGECQHIGCGKQSAPWSAFCKIHRE